jgi:hypothetical protein
VFSFKKGLNQDIFRHNIKTARVTTYTSQFHENQIQSQIIHEILKPITHAEMKVKKYQQAINSVLIAIQTHFLGFHQKNPALLRYEKLLYTMH